MKKKFNINDMAMVTLTPVGVEILSKAYGSHTHCYLDNISGYNDKNRAYRTELWHLMNIFGKSLYMGNSDMPFVNNNITIEREV